MTEHARGDIAPSEMSPTYQKIQRLYNFLMQLEGRLTTSSGGPSVLDKSLTSADIKARHDEPIEKLRREHKLPDFGDDWIKACKLWRDAKKRELSPEENATVDQLLAKYRSIDEELKLGQLEDLS